MLALGVGLVAVILGEFLFAKLQKGFAENF